MYFVDGSLINSFLGENIPKYWYPTLKNIYLTNYNIVVPSDAWRVSSSSVFPYISWGWSSCSKVILGKEKLRVLTARILRVRLKEGLSIIRAPWSCNTSFQLSYVLLPAQFVWQAHYWNNNGMTEQQKVLVLSNFNYFNVSNHTSALIMILVSLPRLY